MRRWIAVATALALVAVVATGGISLFAPLTTDDVAPTHDPAPVLVSPNGTESGFYPYLNSRPRFTQRSPINVVVVGNTSEVMRIMQEETATQWNETAADEEDLGGRPLVEGENETLRNGTVVNESVAENGTIVAENATGDADTAPSNATPANATGLNGSNASENRSFLEEISPTTAWDRTTGATRWAYLDPGGDGEGRWVTETTQFHTGDYYGSRIHVRMYESPNESEEWVAMQAHKEHFDWFTLRHRVDSSEQAQSYVEREFMGQPFVAEDGVYRIYLDNGGPSDSDGWATVIELAYLLPVVLGLGQSGIGSTVRSRLTDDVFEEFDAVRARTTLRHVVLGAVIVALLLGVRFGGVYLENNAPLLSMHAIAALLYPVIGLGIPTATYLLASGLDRQFDAAVTASVALSVAIWLDYGYLGIATLPVEVVLQRVVVILALGLIAGGAAREGTDETRWNRMLLAGVGLWVFVLVGTLLGYL